ncbi:MAG TPA: acyl-CoA dehydrogenase family protein [Fibrobacteria bacterium]|nr:acyl-CoA dehydrogenase family protein [Fibrobacteria bacterium]
MAAESTQKDAEFELKIDTSKMSKEKAEAMLVAESNREDKWESPSFAGGLFMGRFSPELILPFPEQTPDDKAVGDKLCGEIAAFLKANLDADEVDRTREVPKKVLDWFTSKGMWAMKIPKEYGGLGLSQMNYNRAIALVASHCGSTAVWLSAHQSIGVPQPLKLFGTPEQKKKWLPKFAEGAISAFALTELNVGSDPAKMSTTAEPTPDGKHFILNGVKLWCTNGTSADILVVMARTPPKIKNGKEIPQITAFIVTKDMPGVEVMHRCDFMGIRAIHNGQLRFNNVKVPVENIILGVGKGLKLALTTLNTGRLTLPAACVGMGKQCLNIVRNWANERVQWGLPIGKHEAISAKIAYMSSTQFAMESVTWLASMMADRGGYDIRIEAAMAKMFCSEAAWKMVDETMQIRGGRGYETAESLKGRGEKAVPVERMLRDCRINRIIEGTTEIMHLFLAREAMDPHMQVAAEIMLKVPMGRKIRAGLKMANFYSRWYPQQWINGSIFPSYSEFGPKLSRHMNYVERTAHTLGRSIFHAMGMYQNSLERRQLVLARFVDIGTELFAMAATCAHAKLLTEKDPKNPHPQHLANFFCKEARRRVEASFAAISDNDDRQGNKIAKAMMAGEYKWMEEGIVKTYED